MEATTTFTITHGEKSWNIIPTGTRVRIMRNFRTHDGIVTGQPTVYTDHLANTESGVVASNSNAGFRGIEHSVRLDSGRYAVGFSSTDLALIR